MASRVPVPSYVVPTDRFPPRRHEFEQRFVESRQTTGRRGLPVGEFETRQISVPTRLPTRCERLVVAPVPVNGHGSNLVGVPARCPGSNDVEIRRVICSTNAIESFFIEEGPLDYAQLFYQTVGEANYREFLLAQFDSSRYPFFAWSASLAGTAVHRHGAPTCRNLRTAAWRVPAATRR